MNVMPWGKNYRGSKELEEKMKRVAKGKMTKEEIRSQKISFVHGSLPANSNLQREDVEKIVDEGIAGVIGEKSGV